MSIINKYESISLGWNCHSAEYGVKVGLRKRKHEGYNTCPFDLCISSYEGVIKCIEEDFKDFTNPEYLCLIPSPISTGGIVKGERLLTNTKYNIIFNHESPEHNSIFKNEKWENGPEHFILNNFEKFKERYDRRIMNFRKYVHDSSLHIVFLVTKIGEDTSELEYTIKKSLPNLSFQILHIAPPCPKSLIDEHMYLTRLKNYLSVNINEDRTILTKENLRNSSYSNVFKLS